jgi:DNA-binding winged helix-turn-helix (wHTH) protein
VLRGAQPVALSPKAFDLLAYLVEQRPNALSKDVLHERLWPGVFVSDTNLAGLVAEIRRALGTMREPRALSAPCSGLATPAAAADGPRISGARTAR